MEFKENLTKEYLTGNSTHFLWILKIISPKKYVPLHRKFLRQIAK